MSNVGLHKAAHQAIGNRGPNAAAAFFADDIVYIDRARGITLNGRRDATYWIAEWMTAFSDHSITEATYLTAGKWTISRFRRRGLNSGPFGPFKPTARQLDAPFCELLRWEERHAVEGEIYYDLATIINQLGYVSTSAY
jgi:hypothetical protein